MFGGHVKIGACVSCASIGTKTVAVQPFPSVTVAVKTPAPRPVAVAEVWPFDHKNASGAVPPVAEIVAVPV